MSAGGRKGENSGGRRARKGTRETTWRRRERSARRGVRIALEPYRDTDILGHFCRLITRFTDGRWASSPAGRELSDTRAAVEGGRPHRAAEKQKRLLRSRNPGAPTAAATKRRSSQPRAARIEILNGINVLLTDPTRVVPRGRPPPRLRRRERPPRVTTFAEAPDRARALGTPSRAQSPFILSVKTIRIHP